MKALTLHQPWASLIALGVKTIETRHWSTSYRGPLAIHAGARWPEMMHLPLLRRNGTWAEQDEHNHQTWLVINTITDPAFHGPRPQSSRVPKRAQAPTLMWPHAGSHHRPSAKNPEYPHSEVLPLGAIVATCELVDVVPTGTGLLRLRSDAEQRRDPATQWEQHPWPDRLTTFVHDAQLPYGDFTPGRFAWLLADVQPVDPPVPCRGHQGLWTVPEGLLEGARHD